MAGRGRKFIFHGCFTKKSDAVAKEQSVRGSFIHETRIKRGPKKGQTCYTVMTER